MLNRMAMKFQNISEPELRYSLSPEPEHEHEHEHESHVNGLDQQSTGRDKYDSVAAIKADFSSRIPFPRISFIIFKIRPYDSADATALLDLFSETIRKVNNRDYAPPQIDAWSSDSIDTDLWRARFSNRFAYVVECDGRIAGFADMSQEGYLDRLFVSADHQRQGVGRMLCDRLIADARETRLTKIFTEASITAKPFFERLGFHTLQEQSVLCRGVRLVNFRMELPIQADQSS